MKILYITPFVEGAGGVQRVLSTKTNYLIEKYNYEVSILATNSGVDNRHYEFNDNIKFYSEQASGNIFTYLNSYSKILKKHIKKIEPDIIVVCDNGYKGYAIPFILKTKTPIVFECHGSKYIVEKEQPNYFFRIKLKLLFKNFAANRFSKFVALSNESLSEWNVKKGVAIPNPLWFKASQFADLKSKKVIAVGRHSYEKGLDRMIRIWQKSSAKYPDWNLEIYGESNENQELQKLANTLNISSSVTFFAPVKNINNKYLESSIMTMTSRTEGFGMVLVEAMSLGLPCLAYDCPCGPRSIIQNNENGFLVENGNIDLFVEKLELLMGDVNLRIQMGQNAKNSISKYDLDSIMIQWKSLFEEITS